MKEFVLSNSVIERRFEVSERGVATVSLKDLRSGMEYVRKPCCEFLISINDFSYASIVSDTVREVDGNRESCVNAPVFQDARESENSLEMDFILGPLGITIKYSVYPGLCGYRKRITFRNVSKDELRLSEAAFDCTYAPPGCFGECDFYAGNNDVRQSVCFSIEGSEDIIRCHNPEMQCGWLMGSAAPGVLRHFLIYPHWQCIKNGLNCSSAPWAKYLAPGEECVMPDSIFSLYNGALEDQSTVHDFRELIRKNLPELREKEHIMYCTWLPFLKNINSKLTGELTKQAAELGFRTFVLDDGWFTDNDREVDAEKFPNGLEEVSAQVSNAGMRFGLWLNVGTNYGLPNLPEKWLTRRSDGKINRLGTNYAESHDICCFGSGYRFWAAERLSELAARYNVKYFKLDFSNVSSPYCFSSWGCHAHDHEFHRGWADSFQAMYDGMFYLRDYMAEHHPDVTIDFSFEAFGTERPNIAALELSELHHVSNQSARHPQWQQIDRVRTNFYRWLSKLPPERILNGLITLSEDRGAEYLLTTFAGAPLIAGDLRGLSETLKKRLITFSKAFNDEAAKGVMTEFQVLEVQPQTDGFMRFAEDGHGIACCFNRSSEPYSFTAPAGFCFENVETNASELTVQPGDCAMFRVSK